MYLVLLLAACVILGGVVVVAMGRGGELVLFRPDAPSAFLVLRTPADVATLRLPLRPLGYQTQATGDALVAAANLLAARDAEIAALRHELRLLGAGAEVAAGVGGSETAAGQPDAVDPGDVAVADPGDQAVAEPRDAEARSERL